MIGEFPESHTTYCLKVEKGVLCIFSLVLLNEKANLNMIGRHNRFA